MHADNAAVGIIELIRRWKSMLIPRRLWPAQKASSSSRTVRRLLAMQLLWLTSANEKPRMIDAHHVRKAEGPADCITVLISFYFALC